MNASAVTGTLYPTALALANIGLGVVLYLTGTLVFALLLWAGGALVLAGMVSTLNLAAAQSVAASD